MNTVCNTCQGLVEQQHVTYTQWYKGQLIVVENVPAWICTQCGETSYELDVIREVQRLIGSGEPARMMETPVYDMQSEK